MRALFLEKKRIYDFICLAFCGILCILLGLPTNASATTSDAITNLRQQQQQINQQHQSVKQERDYLTNLQQAAQERLNDLQQNLKTTNTQIQDSELRLKLATESLQRLQADLAAKEVAYQQRQAATIARLRFLQRSPVNQGWAVLL